MSNKCTLIIEDEVNCRFKDLDIVTRRKISNAVKFLLPYARHTPAFKMGRWDGMMRFCDIGGRTYINILDELIPIVQDAGYVIEVEDHRKPHHLEFEPVTGNSYSRFKWPEGHRYAGEPVVIMDHQVQAINDYLNNPQSVQSISTGAGKTLISAILSHKCEPYGRTMVIVPSKDLVIQTETQYKDLGLDVGVFFGDRKEYGRTHTICTWQSLESLNKKSKDFDPEIDIDEFTYGVVCIIGDECHQNRAEVLRRLMTTTFRSVPIRWGMTGTIPREKAELMSLTSTIGPVVNQIRATDLQDKGILAKLDISILQLQEHPLKFPDHPSEYKFLTTDKKRIEWLSEHIKHTSQSGNALVLVNRIESGKELLKLIPDAVFISGSMNTKKRKEEYTDVQKATNKVIIATYGVAAVGIDIPRIFNLYLFESGKSFIRVIQSIGRGIRKAKDKDYVRIFDICGSTKYSKRHLTERKRHYKEQGYPSSVKKIDYHGGAKGF